ncbi:hypothetical protein JYB64_22210, partial [Algoriphagus aestuarii]|nr:hypothetical protein [Algoriphagus aestuarii]
PPTTKKEDENAHLTTVAESLPDQDAKLDEVTREAFGEAYADYLRRTRAESQPDDVVAADEHQNQERTVTTGRVDHDGEPAVIYQTPDPDPDLPTPSLDDPIELPAGGDFSFGPRPVSAESPEQARARLEAQLQIWADQGHRTFRAPELRRALAD